MEIKKMDHAAVLKVLPDRKNTAHKGDFGRILLLCGSRGYTGAAALAAMGALRAGAGLVYLCVPESIYVIEAVKLNEAIVKPMPDKNGMFSALAIEEVESMLPNMDAVLIGPGIGRSTDCEQLVLSVLEKFKGPVVLDADGINLMVLHKNILRDRTGKTIITPHEGEFVRLIDRDINDRMQDALATALDLGVVVLLKGHKTVITDGIQVYQNQTGNPGMAVGGSGDMLAGMITSLLGQGISALDSAACAAWLHGAAGDICALKLGQYGMLPTDMLEVLPRLMK